MIRRLFVGLCFCTAALAHANECRDLLSLDVAEAEIQLAQVVKPGTLDIKGRHYFDSSKRGQPFSPESWRDLPTFCRVVASARPSPKSDIKVEVWMPAEGWNGRYVAIGNGGWAGVVYYEYIADVLKRGYAVSGTDTGHTGSPWDAAFARGRPDLLYDFSRLSIHEMARVSKAVILAHYDRQPSRSYYRGCSTGGRQALVEAQLFPNDFDGVVSIAPGTDIVPLNTWYIWVAQAVHGNSGSFIEPEKYPLIHKAAMDRCDANDGITDGVIRDGADCDFDPKVLQCRQAQEDNSSSCLTRLQVEAARKIYAGPTNPRTGERIAYGLEPGAELLWSTLAGGPGANGLANTHFKYLIFDDDDWDFRTFDFDEDFAKARRHDGGWLDATSPNLDHFEHAGGKLLIVHGRADQFISPQFSVSYYESLVERYRSKERVDSFARLFLAPGMYHCAGGTGPSEIDYIGTIENWVESGVAPERIIARHPASDRMERSRPLCPYPLVATYKGSGSTEIASNFACEAH